MKPAGHFPNGRDTRGQRGMSLVETSITAAIVAILGSALYAFGISALNVNAKTVALNLNHHYARNLFQRITCSIQEAVSPPQLIEPADPLKTGWDNLRLVTDNPSTPGQDERFGPAQGLRVWQVVGGPLRVASNATENGSTVVLRTALVTFSNTSSNTTQIKGWYPTGLAPRVARSGLYPYASNAPSFAALSTNYVTPLAGDRLISPLHGVDRMINAVGAASGSGTNAVRTVTLSAALGANLTVGGPDQCVIAYVARRRDYVVEGGDLVQYETAPGSAGQKHMSRVVLARNLATNPVAARPFAIPDQGAGVPDTRFVDLDFTLAPPGATHARWSRSGVRLSTRAPILGPLTQLQP